MHQKGGMRGFQIVLDHDLLLTIVAVEGRNKIVSTDRLCRTMLYAA